MKTIISQKQFKRKETKYILSKATWRLFLRDAQPHLLADDYAHSTITSIYFDNEDFDMVQDALSKKHQREKVRIRIYDAQPHANSTAFLEIKKNRWHWLQVPTGINTAHYSIFPPYRFARQQPTRPTCLPRNSIASETVWQSLSENSHSL